MSLQPRGYTTNTGIDTIDLDAHISQMEIAPSPSGPCQEEVATGLPSYAADFALLHLHKTMVLYSSATLQCQGHHYPEVSMELSLLHQQASSLIRAGSEMLLVGGVEDAQVFFDTSHALIMKMSACTKMEKMQSLERALAQSLERALAQTTSPDHDPSTSCQSWPASPPDIYDSEVAPRLLMKPIFPTSNLFDSCTQAIAPCGTNINSLLLEIVVIHNKGLVFQTKGQSLEAVQMYEFVSQSSQWMFELLSSRQHQGQCSTQLAVAALAMRSCNNLGVAHFISNNISHAECYFTLSVRFARQIASLSMEYAAEYATALSNLCRVQWRTLDRSSDLVLQNLETVQAVRTTALGCGHPDTAASVFNTAMALYARQDRTNASRRLLHYLALASSLSRRSFDDRFHDEAKLDIVPALILLLLIQNENEDNELSRELVRGLRILQEKRQRGSSPDVASVLNYVGTMLFHQEQFEHALVFFLEELQLEDKAPLLARATECSSSSPSVVSVTCNNIGRITQELGRFDEAVHYYKRSLEHWYGEELNLSSLNVKEQIEATNRKITACNNHSTIVNLYSTVWYNLGLILDKLCSYDEAMVAFEMALALRQALVGRNHPDIACLLYNIGVLQMENKRLVDASASLSKAITIRRAGISGQLSDLYLIKTLEKLSKLHQKAGNIPKALDSLQEMISLQETTPELDEISREEAMGVALASISDLQLTLNQLDASAESAARSVQKLHGVLQTMASNSGSKQCFGPHSNDRTTVVEHLISSLLLLGSIYHELCDPLQAQSAMVQAKQLAFASKEEWNGQSGEPSSLHAICEVTTLLSQSCAAAQA